MFKGTVHGIKPGDLFAKVDDPETIWTVVRLVDVPRLPLHAELTSDTFSKRKILISEAALFDRRLYRPVSDRNDARALVEAANKHKHKHKRRGFFASLFR